MSILDRLPGRTASTGEPELLAALHNSQAELVRIEGEAAAMVGRARGEVSKAQGALDTYRVGLVRENAAGWRTRAVQLRSEAEAAGDSTAVITVHTFNANGAYAKPELVFVRTLRLEEADRADATAAHLEGRLATGDLAGEALALLVSQLEELPAETSELAAV